MRDPCEVGASDRRRFERGRLAALALSAVLALAGSAEAQSRTGSEGDKIPPAELAASRPLGRDSVLAAPGKDYPAGAIHRWLMGDLNRDAWQIPFAVPVLDLDSVGGGLVVEEPAGGSETVGLRFRGADGLTYQFRSIVKDVSGAIPSVLRSTPVDDVWQDQMAAQYPLSAIVVAHLQLAAGLLVAVPRPVIMPDDPRLGEFREAFAGVMGWIEIRPNERDGDRPGFAGSRKVVGSERLYEILRTEPSSFVHVEEFLRARLIDMFVGDWDRHEDQWRWAEFPDGRRSRWDPVPLDRDWALSRIDGLLPRLAGVYFPRYMGLSGDLDDPKRLGWAAQAMDRRLLGSVEREVVASVATGLRDTFSDDVLEDAVGALPEPHRSLVGPGLLSDLKSRRDQIVSFATSYYELLARSVSLWGTDQADVVTIEVEPNERIRVRMTADANLPPGVDRAFEGSETRELRLYLRGGDDRVVIRGVDRLPVRIHIVGGAGDDVFLDEAGLRGRGLNVYDHEGSNEFQLTDWAVVDDSFYEGEDEETTRVDATWDTRSWGSAWVPLPAVRYDSDAGLLLGAHVKYYDFGFRHLPYRSKVELRALTSTRPGESEGALSVVVPPGNGRATEAAVSFQWTTDRGTRFFGYGNETQPDEAAGGFYGSRRTEIRYSVRVQHPVATNARIWIGPAVHLFDAVADEGTVFEVENPYGVGRFRQLGLRGGIVWRDPNPRTGLWGELTGKWFPVALDVTNGFGGIEGVLNASWTADLFASPQFRARLTGQRVWGRAPYPEAASIGGAGTLPGYRARRFLGDRAVSVTGLLRLEAGKIPLASGLAFGIQMLHSAGRVWHADERSDTWHQAPGVGLWVRSEATDRTFSFSWLRGDMGVRSYFQVDGFF